MAKFSHGTHQWQPASPFGVRGSGVCYRQDCDCRDCEKHGWSGLCEDSLNDLSGYNCVDCNEIGHCCMGYNCWDDWSHCYCIVDCNYCDGVVNGHGRHGWMNCMSMG